MKARTLWRGILAGTLLSAAAMTSYGCAIVAGIQPPAPVTCADGKQNGDETSVDCGGLCGSCDGTKCTMDAECKSGICDHTVCAPPTNADACPPGGGSSHCQACHDCGLNAPCVSDVDCATGLCKGHVCIKCNPNGDNCADQKCSGDGLCLTITCANGVKNANESDVDCGGDCGSALSKWCGLGQKCNQSNDCSGDVELACVPATGGTCQAVCTAACGVGCAAFCADSAACAKDDDCMSAFCDPATKVCQVQPTCSDHMKDGQETDVDCGGPQCSSCDAGKTCNDGSDCVSGTCTAMTCDPPAHCTNMHKDANVGETDVDCGGECPPCAIDQRCVVQADCAQPAICLNTICRAASCNAQVCTVPACGKCAGQPCTTDIECWSSHCDTQTTNACLL